MSENNTNRKSKKRNLDLFSIYKLNCWIICNECLRLRCGASEGNLEKITNRILERFRENRAIYYFQKDWVTIKRVKSEVRLEIAQGLLAGKSKWVLSLSFTEVKELKAEKRLVECIMLLCLFTLENIWHKEYR